MKSYPEYFFIELTQNCNLYCSMCRPKIMCNHDWYMSDELLEKSCALAEKYAKVVDLRGWGESSLDDRLIPIAERFKSKGIKTRLYTNLNARSPQYWVELVKTGIELAISIETGNAEHYQELRRGGNLERVKRNLKAIMNTCSECSSIIMPYFTVVISENNLDDLMTIVSLAKEMGIKTIELNPISCRDELEPSGRRTGLRKSNRDYAVKRLKEMSEYGAENGIKIELAANLFSENENDAYECIHPWKYCCICMDGTITFCDHLLHNKGAIMGNMKIEGFEDIWFGNKYSKLRDNHQKLAFADYTSIGIECEWCYNNRYGNSECLIEPSIKPILLHKYLERMNESL